MKRFSKNHIDFSHREENLKSGFLESQDNIFSTKISMETVYWNPLKVPNFSSHIRLAQRSRR